jgi:chemotaxis response regulator CheB
MLRILVVDDTRLYREGLAELLSRDSEMLVVGTAAHKEEAIACITHLRPDLALVRMSMAGGVPTLYEIAHVSPAVKVVAIGITETEQEVIACAEAGIAGYTVLANAPPPYQPRTRDIGFCRYGTLEQGNRPAALHRSAHCEESRAQRVGETPGPPPRRSGSALEKRAARPRARIQARALSLFWISRSIPVTGCML